ncbi:3-carboxy-cis,cis-muconate cycloisomerase [Neorhizobium sp. P12A]|uniref:3-carboxy-cis,cis-muconate cycloisomerase n=1 Tax=Neorhizobium sp. P12A TaxID=2268027 RepID=UPI0011EC9CDF|nr:3-carboxy-cis,cis-muconate cycloisomerase [Neorhizobium sp. P12A]KAA0690971.1 3-carboxy-cis,cis-muconate cycloisomerase [Neorhizobium sp. P12A]
MSVSPFDHPYLSGLLGDEEMGIYFSADADIRAMLSFEAALGKAEARHGVIPEGAAARIGEICSSFKPDIAVLKAGTASDGVVVPSLVRQLRDAVGGDEARFVHFGATSQDVIDTSLMIRLKAVCFLLSARLSVLGEMLQGLERQFGKHRLMAHTRMQAAIPMSVSDRLRAWSDPLGRYRERLTNESFLLQFGGAAGTLDQLGDKAAAVRAALAQELDLTDARQWQSQRDRIADFGGLLSLITGSLGKIGQDIALMAQGGTEIALYGGGRSSAMAHKQNPVAAETLVALARFNAVQISALHQSMVHEQERSGAAWTLEWMVLPQMATACGAALRLAQELIKSIIRIGNAD